MKDILKQVIAGAILLVIAPGITYFLGWWPSIFKFIIGFIDWLGKMTSIDNWFLIFLSVLIIFLITRKMPHASINHTQQMQPQTKPQIQNNVPRPIGGYRLEKMEEDILLCLANNGYKQMASTDLVQNFVAVAPAKFQYHIHNLREKNFLDFNIFHETYFLSQRGRAYLVENNLI